MASMGLLTTWQSRHIQIAYMAAHGSKKLRWELPVLLKPEPRSGTASLLLLFSVKAATSQSRFEERRHISTAEWEEGLRRWGLIYPTVEVLVLYCCCNKISHI